MKPEASVDLMGAFVVWGPLASACWGGAESAGHLGALGFVDVGAYVACGVAFQGSSVGWGGAGRAEMLAEKLGGFAGGPEKALAWSLALSAGAAGVRSLVESGSLGAFGAGADSHFVDVVALDLEMPAGTAGEHQVEGAYIHVESLAGSGQVAEGQEWPLVQAGIPEAAAAQRAEGTAVAACVAVVGIQEVGPGHE